MLSTLPTSDALYWSTLFAAIFSAAAGILEVRHKPYDLFGMLMVAFCAALGGGTLRDLLLERPVFWLVEPSYLIFTWSGALITFFIVRLIKLNARWFLLPDAIALGLYTVAGTQAALMMQTHWLIACFMGVITAVAGGILRDVLSNQEPFIFTHSPWYATASFVGAALLCVLHQMHINPAWAMMAATLCTICLRLAALHWHLTLPLYQEKKHK